MTVTSVVCLVVGALLLVMGVWERHGRSRNARAWTRARSERAWRNALFTRPGLGVVLATLGVFGLVRDVPVVAPLLAVVAVAALALTFWWGILAFPCPSWAVPRWARADWTAGRQGAWDR
jgi:hypothetical protein